MDWGVTLLLLSLLYVIHDVFKRLCAAPRPVLPTTIHDLPATISTGTQTIERRIRTRDISTQSQCTYTFKNLEPRFKPLGEHSHGTFIGP